MRAETGPRAWADCWPTGVLSCSQASARDGSLVDLPMEQRMQQACTVGWAIEILQVYYLVSLRTRHAYGI